MLIFVDVGVKHATSLRDRGLASNTRDLPEPVLVDALIVSGELTGSDTRPEDVDAVRHPTPLPVLISSGVTPDTLPQVYATRGWVVNRRQLLETGWAGRKPGRGSTRQGVYGYCHSPEKRLKQRRCCRPQWRLSRSARVEPSGGMPV
ncbi:hypothetical protein NKDENANG_03827 [Candidatus Entotheonellaceae bacterium PAL068K]